MGKRREEEYKKYKNNSMRTPTATPAEAAAAVETIRISLDADGLTVL